MTTASNFETYSILSQLKTKTRLLLIWTSTSLFQSTHLERSGERNRFDLVYHPPANNSSTTSHKIRLSECSHGSPFCFHRVSPPPTNPCTDIRKRSQPILNSLPTHQLHHSHILNFPHSARVSWRVTPLPHRCHTPISWQQDRTNWSPPGYYTELHRWELDVITTMPFSTTALHILQFINCPRHSLGL